jgi:hypothetical protein
VKYIHQEEGMKPVAIAIIEVTGFGAEVCEAD